MAEFKAKVEIPLSCLVEISAVLDKLELWVPRTSMFSGKIRAILAPYLDGNHNTEAKLVESIKQAKAGTA